MQYEQYLKVIDEKQPEIEALSDYIWEHAEPAYHEFKSSKRLSDELEANGFTVTRKLIGMPTAFKATYGEGHPAFGILAEFDALDGLAQEAGALSPKPLEGKRYGHGCGHNLFAGGSFAAAIAVKAFLEDRGAGSVTLFGCPAEEGGGGKAFMAREGVFKGIDAFVSWHPERFFMPRTRPSLAAVSIDYSFKGIAAHAGGSPQRGRSALDAVELMNVGANYLREHMDYTSRIHYAMIDSGGTAPNVVQAHATVRYMIRTVDSESLAALVARVDKVAQGAALMTETEMSKAMLPAYSNLITNSVLQKTAYEAMSDIPVPQPDENDLAFGKALQETMSLSSADKKLPLYQSFVVPPAPPKPHGGSTDTADVSWNAPTVQMHIGNWVTGTPGHSWQAVAQGKSRYAKAAMLYAGKAIAGTIFRLYDDPALLLEARKEFLEKTESGYVNLNPPEVQPPVPPREEWPEDYR
ncbi:MAG: amidohydrolase [Lachnospiraceae bacterium]|nr:amidohydrolase [Lachnospiraceae bacterium]